MRCAIYPTNGQSDRYQFLFSSSSSSTSRASTCGGLSFVVCTKNSVPRHSEHPIENSSPLGGCSMPSGHFSGPGHCIRSFFALVVIKSWFSCRLWQSTQKCVFPQQKYVATAQQNLHLYTI